MAPTKKRKETPSSDSEHDVKQNIQDIMPLNKVVGKKVPTNVPEVPIDNIFFHSVENVGKCKFEYQRRLALEIELGKDDLECKEVVSIIENVWLMKSVVGFGKYYETLVKEFIINIPTDCDNKKSKEYIKLYVRGRGMKFSPKVNNKFMGRCEDEQTEVEVIDNNVYKEITAKQVSQWPRKGKPSTSKLSVKYVMLHRIGASNWIPTNHTSTIATGLGKFTYIVGTKTMFDFGSYVFEKTLKHTSTFVVKMPSVFTSLIYGIIPSHPPGILISSDATSNRESPLSLHYRLFAETCVPNIVVTSGEGISISTSKDGIIIKLKDTYKALDETVKTCTEKKIRLERLTNALTEEVSR
ncbi:uncharacterized protein LOC127121740 [Lathyrus oleraceus]|uniref:uncharacterized protein LOC127121740 n=1 Tax=Pisum sativum TaxID=3888 RepID=UPI0021CE0DDD|nr:uncharacterized protein LOC127121740 [Pisum sativum]